MSTVKFVWFNLMPWPHLPADFRQRHRSVWVDTPIRVAGSIHMLPYEQPDAAAEAVEKFLAAC